MDFFANPRNFQLLQDLLKEPEEQPSDAEPEPDDRVPSFGVKFSSKSSTLAPQGQSSVGPEGDVDSSNCLELNQRFDKSGENPPESLSEWEEQEALLNDDELEHRLTPEYRIIYKQSVAPEDIYLQMSNKTASTASCEEMCMDILMPNETVSIDRMELNVTAHEIDLRTPIYRLKLPLVQPTDPDRGQAKWNDNEKMLRLTLRMKREYDFINF